MAEDPQLGDTHQHPECVNGRREADKDPDKEGEREGKREGGKEGEGSGETFTMEQEMKISDVEDKDLLESSLRLKPHEAQSYRKKALWVSWVSIVVTLILAIAAFKTMDEVRLLLKARDGGFKSGNTEDYSRARANLKRGIRKAKQAHKLHIEEHFHNNSDPRRMWKGIQTITDHKPSIQSLPTSNAFLPDEFNHFFACFNKGVIRHTRNAEPSTAVHPISLSTTEVHSALSRVDPRKSAGPDGIPGRVLRVCADQLAQVFTDIFNLPLAQATVPTCLKTTTIIPVPKHSSAECLNDFRPVALTPIVMKCFEKLVLSHLIACLPPTLDPHQFAYHPNRSTEDTISTAIRLALTHLDNNNTYIRMLFIDFSSAFNTVVLSKLTAKLSDLAVSAMRSSASAFGFAFDAALDVLSSIIVLWRYSNAAAVHSAHREYIACVVLGVVFILSALTILVKAIHALATRVLPEVDDFLYSVSVLSGLVCTILAVLKCMLGKVLTSRALITDGFNSLVGGVMGFSILISAEVFKHNPKVWYLDGAIGVLIGLIILAYGIK
ncbi:hypothetical protein QTP70_018489 [Hemibagrus guttatus]|uniref:Reverse transcriptase domain-containing protein n=1 Tax=Hemibagrus guttatus TaxID=175788 RepID=A0AAE0PXZ0_9TELE|nr:hypothetical protein QTP70_018489 [Hemibagrus guttatus]